MAFPEIIVPHVDAVSRMESRTLLQFRRAQVFLQVLAAFAQELQALQDACEAVIQERTVAQAVGEQLETLGRIVGQPRGVASYDDTIWFVPDVNSVDQTRQWVPGGLYLGQFVADDATYRQFIESRIYRNFSKYGSIPEIQRAFTTAYGFTISFVRMGPMTVEAVIPDTANEIAKAAVLNFFSDEHADFKSVLPIPATVHINAIYTVSEYNIFAASSNRFAAESWLFGTEPT